MRAPNLKPFGWHAGASTSIVSKTFTRVLSVCCSMSRWVLGIRGSFAGGIEKIIEQWRRELFHPVLRIQSFEESAVVHFFHNARIHEIFYLHVTDAGDFESS